MKKILVIGSINIDQVINVTKLPKNGQTIPGNSIEYHAGGKGANQAAAIAKMKGNVKLLCASGKDEWGDICINSCKNCGVDTSRSIRMENEKTGMASIYVQDDGLNSIVLLFGANECLTKEKIDENIDLIKECDYLVTQLEINSEAIFYALKIARQLNKITILNPAPARILTNEELSVCNYLIPNETELEIISGIPIKNDHDLKLACEKIIKQNEIIEIIATYGPHGVFYYDKNKKNIINFPALKTNVVDTTAAGDSFIGGFVSKLSQGKSIVDAIQFALKVSAITVSRKGAQIAIPTYGEIK